MYPPKNAVCQAELTAPTLICPNLTLYFRNAFICFECCALHAVTTHKPKVDRSMAVTNRISTFYNQQNEKL